MTDRDIVKRIRSLRYVHVPVASQLFEEAANEIERLRLQLRERGTAVSDNCGTGNQREMKYPVTKPMPKEKLAEVSVSLTDDEREAVKLATDFLEDEFYGCSDKCAAEHAAVTTLRKLLERMK